MKIVVCLRQGTDGEINPFDASAYETALRISGAEITLLSMGPLSVADLLSRLSRLGAKRALLLSDKRFAGADTLATAYALSLAIEKLSPDLVICGRQTLIGDTGQTGPMLAELTKRALVTGVLDAKAEGAQILCETRSEGEIALSPPALITVEKKNVLRLPSLRSRPVEVETWSFEDIGADPARCGLAGSPTRVLQTFENLSGRRRCRFISRKELDGVIKAALEKTAPKTVAAEGGERLKNVWIIGEAPRAFAQSVSDDVISLPLTDVADLSQKIAEGKPTAVLWGSDPLSKRTAARVAARLGLGLCADCTALEAQDGRLLMIRPALSGSVIAKIKSLTLPAMATVRTGEEQDARIFVGAGFGVKDKLENVARFAQEQNAELVVSRKLVDNGYAPYERQVGLTGRIISPPVYIAIGISGAVHHIVGIERAGTVIAINPDKNAPIFDYADFGVIDEF